MSGANSMADGELQSEYVRTGDVSLRNELAERYGYIAEITAKKFSGGAAEYDDLYQVGMLAIIKALPRFDSGKNIKLSTYLTHCVSGEIKNYFRDRCDPYKVSRDVKKLRRDISRLTETANGRPMSAAEIASELGVSAEKVVEAMEYTGTAISLDATAGDDGCPIYDLIPDTDDGFAAVENRDFFESCLKLLGENERKLLIFRFRDGLSQTETAKRLGVSQMLVSRLERKIIERLKKLA